jgi:protein phosphatase
LLKLDPVAKTDVGRRRNHNEDFLGDLIFKSGRKYGPDKLNERGYLFAVADGMGGHASGEVASEMAVTTLFERYYNNPSSGDTWSDLMTAVKEANFQVHKAGMSSGRGQMGTTLTLALIKGNRAVIGNVGDSRTYLIRQGLAERVTHDHSLVQDQIDMGALTPEQAERSMIRNVITRAIGHREEVEPDFFERELEPQDVLLLCSDGLHGAVHEEEMGLIVATAPSLKDAADQLIGLANERGGIDNISVMLIGVSEVGDPIPPILNGRGAYYPPPPRPEATQSFLVDPPTDRLTGSNRAQTSGEVGTNTVTLDPSNAPTAPNPTAAPPPASSGAETTKNYQATKPMRAATPVRKKGGIGPLIIGLFIILLAGAVVAAVLLNSNNNTTATPTTVASTTATTTSVPASPTAAMTPLPTVTVGAAATPVGTTQAVSGGSSKLAIDLAQIKKIRIVLQNFPAGNYTVVMNQSLSGSNSTGADITFTGAGNNIYDSENVNLGRGSYRVTIQSPAGQDTVILNLADTEANSEARVSLSKPDNSTLQLTISPKA